MSLHPGEIRLLAENQVTFSLMHRSSGFFKWSNPEDEINYHMVSVIAKIDPPTVAGN